MFLGVTKFIEEYFCFVIFYLLLFLKGPEVDLVCLFVGFGKIVYLYLFFCVLFFRCDYRLVSHLDFFSCIRNTNLNLSAFSVTDVNLKCKRKGVFGQKNK